MINFKKAVGKLAGKLLGNLFSCVLEHKNAYHRLNFNACFRLLHDVFLVKFA